MAGIIRLESYQATVSANSKATVVELTPPQGHTYRILEIAFSLSGAGYFEIYINEQRLTEHLYKDAIDIDKRRILVNWELKQGDKLKIIAYDTSGSTNTATVFIVYEDVTS